MTATSDLRLPGYDQVGVLGQGGNGIVFLARQVSLDRFVAVKRLPAGQGSTEAITRLRREARALARLQHPNIIQVYALEVLDGDLYVIMEYVAGGSLADSLARALPPRHAALRILAELAAALDHAADSGVIHRDLKPSNIFLTPDGGCKLGDFGLAKILDQESGFTADGTVMGTLAYLSPEQAAGSAKVDRRCDVYSLGVLAYELLVGRRPFPVDPANPLRTLDAHLHQPPPPTRTVDPTFPHAVELVLMKALAKDRGQRWRTAGTFWRELRRRALESWPGPGIADLDATVVMTRPARRRVVLGGLAGAGLFAAVVVLVLLALRPADSVGRSPGHTSAPATLTVVGVSISVDPPDATGHCPRATMRFAGRIDTNGAPGTISYRWLQPDGRLSEITTVVVAEGRPVADAVLEFTYTGRGSSSGVAALHVLSPTDAYSAPMPVRYVCD